MKEKILSKGQFYSCSLNALRDTEETVYKVGFKTLEQAKYWQSLLPKENYDKMWFEDENGNEVK